MFPLIIASPPGLEEGKETQTITQPPPHLTLSMDLKSSDAASYLLLNFFTSGHTVLLSKIFCPTSGCQTGSSQDIS